MTADKDYKVKGSPCPGCKADQTGAFGPDSDRQPEPGDFSVCFYCQGLFVFDENMRLRDLEASEILELPLDMVSRYQRTITRLKREGKK